MNYAVVEDKENDEFWEKVVSESSAISKQYGECKLIINLVLAAITELERQLKELRLQNSEEVRNDNKYGNDK